MPRSLDADLLQQALGLLDARIGQRAHLIVGGGAAMVAAYDHPLATSDVDAMTAKGSVRIADLDQAAKGIARELDLASDWLNPYFESYAGVLPPDYGTRLRNIFQGERLRVDALGPEDLLVMKCFAGRDKDRPHARRLIAIAEDLDVVDRRLSDLIDDGYPKAERAADYFDDLRDEADR